MHTLRCYLDKTKIKVIKEVQPVEKTIENYHTFNKLVKDFHDLTGMDLPIGHFGLDVIQLDKMLGTPDGVSISDYLTKKWGKDANKIVEKIVNMKLTYNAEHGALAYFMKKNW